MKLLISSVAGVMAFASVASAQQRVLSPNMATEVANVNGGTQSAAAGRALSPNMVTEMAYVGVRQNPQAAPQAAKPAAGAPAATAAPSLAGTWNMLVDVPQQGPLANTLVLKLDGKTVTGTIGSQMYGETPIKGEFADGKLTFTMTFSGQGQPFDITFTGKLGDDGKMSGTASLGEMGDMTWKAERAKRSEAETSDETIATNRRGPRTEIRT